MGDGVQQDPFKNPIQTLDQTWSVLYTENFHCNSNQNCSTPPFTSGAFYSIAYVSVLHFIFPLAKVGNFSQQPIDFRALVLLADKPKSLRVTSNIPHAAQVMVVSPVVGARKAHSCYPL